MPRAAVVGPDRTLCSSGVPAVWNVPSTVRTPHVVTHLCNRSAPLPPACRDGWPACSSQWPVPNMPALLWSCAGSGNTLTRSLIETRTDHLTGSVYHDTESTAVFAGEQLPVNTTFGCAGMSVIKVHGARYEGPWCATLCGGGVVTRAVFLVRHPFRAALAEYQRSVAVVDKHLELVKRRKSEYADGEAPNTNARAVNVTASVAYGGWARRGPELVLRWADLMSCADVRRRGCQQPDKSYGAWLAMSSRHEAVWVRYEDLTAQQTSIAEAELQRVIKFACPHCSTQPPLTPRLSRASVAWGHRGGRVLGGMNVADVVEAGGTGSKMWAKVSSLAPQLGYERFNYDAIGCDAHDAAEHIRLARAFAANPSPSAAPFVGPHNRTLARRPYYLKTVQALGRRRPLSA